MANITVRACLDKWLAGDDDNAQRDTAVAQLTQFLSDKRMAVVSLAIDGLTVPQQLAVCAAMLSVIASKAGADSDGQYDASVGLADAVLDEEADLTLADTERFTAAATALTDQQLLQAAALPPAMHTVPAAPEDGEAQPAPIVIFRHRFAMASHPDDPKARLTLLMDGADVPEAPAAMNGAEQLRYYERLAGIAVNPAHLAVDGAAGVSPLVHTARILQSWHAAQQLVSRGFVGDASPAEQLAAMHTAFHEALGGYGLVPALGAAQEAVFKQMSVEQQLAVYQAIAAGAVNGVGQRIQQQCVAGALIVAAQDTTVAIKQIALMQALNGAPEGGATAVLFADVPEAEQYQVLQAMVRVADTHAGEIAVGQTPLQWLQAQMAEPGSEVIRGLHLAVAAVLPQQIDCSRAIANRVRAALGVRSTDPQRARFNAILRPILGGLAEADALAALHRIADGDLIGLSQRIDHEALQAAADLVGQGAITRPGSDAEVTGAHNRYRACAVALGLVPEAELPANIKAYLLPEPANAFAPQRTQAVLREMIQLVEGGSSLADARAQVEVAVGAAVDGEAPSVIEGRRRLHLHEAVAIAALPVTTRGRAVAVRAAFAAGVGLADPALLEVRANPLRLVGEPIVARRQRRGAARVRYTAGISLRSIEIYAAGAAAMLAGGDVPQIADVAALRGHPAIMAAQQLHTDDTLQAVRAAIAVVDDTPATRQAAAQAVLRAFGHAGDTDAADALLERMQVAMGEGEQSAATWQAALRGVLTEMNTRAVTPAAVQALLTAPRLPGVLDSLLASRVAELDTAVGYVKAAQPVLREPVDDGDTDAPAVIDAADALAQLVVRRRQVQAVVEAHPELITGKDPAVCAVQMLAVPGALAADPISDAIMLGWADSIDGAAQGAEGVSLDAQVAGLDAVQLAKLYEMIQDQFPVNDAAVRAFINTVTLANSQPVHSALTINDLLTAIATADAASPLVQPLPASLVAETRSRRATAVAAVLQVEEPQALGATDMARVPMRISALVGGVLPPAAAYYAEDPTATQSVAAVTRALLSAAPDEGVWADAERAGSAVHEVAALTTGDTTNEAMLQALVVESMLHAANQQPTEAAAIHAMFVSLHNAGTAYRGTEHDPAKASAFADRCVAYLHGDRRAAVWARGELAGPFEALRCDMLGVPTPSRSIVGALWDPADMAGRAALTDTQRLTHMRGCLADAAARLEAVQGAAGIHQLQLRHAVQSVLRVVQAKPTKGIVSRGKHALQQALGSLYRGGVIRLEDMTTMMRQYDACTSLDAVRALLDSIATHGWDFTYGRAGSAALGFEPVGAVPVRVSSLAARAAQAATDIGAMVGPTVRVRLTQVPVLQQATKSGVHIKQGEHVEGPGDAVIQIGDAKPGAMEGKVTLRRTGAVMTQDPRMVGAMVRALLAANPQGGKFSPTTALMACQKLLGAALVALADASKGTGAKWQITLSAQVQQSLPATLRDRLASGGVTLEAATPSARPGTPPMPATRSAVPTSRLMHDAMKKAAVSAQRGADGPVLTPGVGGRG